MNRRPLSLVLCLLTPLVILCVGLGFAGVKGWRFFREIGAEDGRGLVPPGFVVDIAAPGKHTLWMHARTNFEGVAFQSGDRLPEGARVSITPEQGGASVSLNEWSASRKSIGGDSAVSVATFVVHLPGRYAVSGSGFSRPVVLSVAPAKWDKVMGAVLEMAGIVVVTVLLALMILIVLLHRRQRSLQAEARMREPAKAGPLNRSGEG
jgi:hypothetical protein